MSDSTETIDPTASATHSDRSWVVFTAFVAFIAMLAAVFAAGMAWRAFDESEALVEVQASGRMTIEVELGEMFVRPSSIEVAAGTELVLVVHNAGTIDHDLKLDGTLGTELLKPGETETVNLGVQQASGEAWCTIPGHREAGMTMDIVVTGGTSTDGAAAPSDGHGAGGSASGDFASIDPAAVPGPDWNPRDAAAPVTPSGTLHEIELRATEEILEVAPGVTQLMWTFGGEVPGPTIRAKIGDTIRVTLHNDGALGHSIDFHASKVAWNDEMRTIGPGESLVYEYEAKHSGIFMYHCGTAPTLHHIGNGMYGAVIIDPPDLEPVDHEFVFVQSEFYFGALDQPGDLTKMINDEWDAVVFNGYANQYLYRPIRVEPGERIRAWVMDDGPSENSSFHIVGTIFDTSYKEGAYLLRPDDGMFGGSQALDLQPAQGGFVEFTFDEAGLYPIVTHKFSNVGKGALGFFQAGDVVLPEAMSH